MTDRILNPHQAQTAEPSAFENALGDTIEAAYAAGVHDLDGLVAQLVEHGPPRSDGETWTTANFTALMAELGN